MDRKIGGEFVEIVMPNFVSSIWHSMPEDLVSRLSTCIDAAFSNAPKPVYVFFRADDVAVPGNQFARLMELFTLHRTPLSLAVVPSWLTRPHWQNLNELGRKAPSLWCWHQHGWRHINHEVDGKKQEFGPSRLLSMIRADLNRGKSRLQDLIGESFYPVFTPPWNRCSLETLELLNELGYNAVSRSMDSKPPPPDGLPDFPINVDLHTRKETNPVEAWNSLFTELGQAISSGFCGIMIHHQRMIETSFTFIDCLLHTMFCKKDLLLVHLKELAGSVTVK